MLLYNLQLLPSLFLPGREKENISSCILLFACGIMLLCNPNKEVEAVKRILNGLLVLILGISLYLLVFQGFAAPHLSPFGNLCLRILAASSGQWLICRNARLDLVRLLPAVCLSFFAVWGFFLLLSSPSWQHATFWGFLADYVSPAAASWAVWDAYRRFYK